MATYLQGQQDYVTQIQPTKPNLQFDAQILGTLQSKYDAGHKKVSELYGSLLNSAMTRTDNIEARNEFFQMINQDIRRMGSLDFSLQQNVDAAANVFQSIYTNKGIVKDMVWTKNFQNQMSKRNGLKNSTDTDKTGAAWDIGDRAMAYQREAFANATAEEALNMRNAEYAPQFNLMKDAMKLAEKAKLNVTIDKVTGKYKITTKNGNLIKTPLTLLFKETLAKDPKYKSMYDAQAYVGREDWIHNRVKTGEAADLDQAKIDYLQDYKTRQDNRLKKSADALSVDIEYLGKEVEKEIKAFEEGKFKAGSDRYKKLVELQELQAGAQSAKEYTDRLIAAEKSTNPDAAYDVLARNIDARNSYNLMNNDITAAVRTLAFKDAEETMTADEFAKIDVNHKNKLDEMSKKFWYDTQLQSQKDAAALQRAQLKAGSENLGAQNTKANKENNIAKVILDKKEGRFTPTGIQNQILNHSTWKDKKVNTPITTGQVEAWKKSNSGNYQHYLKVTALVNSGAKKAQMDANRDFAYKNKAGAVSAGYDEIPAPDLFTVANLSQSWGNSMRGDKTVLNEMTYYVAEQKGYDVNNNEDLKKVYNALVKVANGELGNSNQTVMEAIASELPKK